MDAKRVNKSFMALSRSDSGLTLVNSDSLVRKNEQQQLEIETKSKKIVELEDIVYNLEDVIVKCKSLKLLHRIRAGSRRAGRNTKRRGQPIKEGTLQIRELTHNSPSHFPAFLGKVLILPICRILINSFYMLLKR